MPNTMPLGKGTSDANRFEAKKEAAAKRFVNFADSLEMFHSGEIISIFDIVHSKLNDKELRSMLVRIHRELGRIL